MPQLCARLAEVRRRIAEAALRSGRQPDEVTLVAVTKGMPEDVVRLAVEAGIHDIGENRVQEALQKKDALSGKARFHLVGHLQRNKARKAVALFDVIHTVDSAELGTILDDEARREGRIVEVLVQVNVAHDPAKHGIRADQVPALLSVLGPLRGLRVIGLMTIGPMVSTAEESRVHFRALRELRDELSVDWPQLRHLSMGMSNDYAIAVEEGATLVRIGTALFGPRTT